MTSDRDEREHRSRRWLAIGGFGLLTGIALSAIGQGPIGGWIAVAAAAAMIVGLHTFGRLGMDAPEVPLPEKKKKRKRKSKPQD